MTKPNGVARRSTRRSNPRRTLRKPSRKTQIKRLSRDETTRLRLRVIAETMEKMHKELKAKDRMIRSLTHFARKENEERGRESSKEVHDVVRDGEIRSLAFFKPERGFESVIGLEREKEYLRDNVILGIRRPDLFKKYSRRLGTGLILYGPPGVGKTHLIRALAKEAEANLLVARFNQVVDKYWGNTEKNIHRIFEIARRHSPCIIFIDEIDGLGVDRDDSIGGTHGQYMAFVVNQLLYEMDGIDQSMDRIFVIGATNRPWKVDTSLKRSGRFTDSLYVRPPSESERKSLFEFFTKGVPCEDMDFDSISKLTGGYSPADVEAVCEKAKILLIRCEAITKEERKLTTVDLVGLIQADPTRGAAVRHWYSIAARTLGRIRRGGEDLFYQELFSDIAKWFDANQSTRNHGAYR
jgi:SpoVK/Ycf46/Vps4 family AAA+-type ATPase